MRTFQPSLALLLLLVGATSVCSAATIYNVNLTIGSGSVTGNIVTDGTIGILSNSNFVGWNLMLNDGIDAPLTLTGLNSVVLDNGPLSATATQLLFDFSGTANYSAFYQSGGTYGSGVCWSIAPVNCIIPGATASGVYLLVNSQVANSQFTSLSGTQVIGTASTPEPSTLVLLGAGITLLGLRRHRKIKMQ